MSNALADHLSHYISSPYADAVISDFNFLVSGFESEIYTFRLRSSHLPQENYILRLFPGAGAAGKLIREAKGLSLLQQAGFPVPGVLLQEADPQILGKPFEIIDKLDGRTLWPILATVEPHLANRLLTRFGLLLAQLHRLDWRLFTANPGVYEKNPTILLDEMFSEYRSLYTTYHLNGFLQIIDWLDAHKHEVSFRPAVVHQDFHANNVLLCSDNRLFVIDWTQIAVSDFRIDLCWTLLIMGDMGNAGWGKQILNAYASNANGPIEQLDYFNVIVYMKLLASVVISHTFSPGELGLRPEAVELSNRQLSIYKRLTQRIHDVTGITIPELENMLQGV